MITWGISSESHNAALSVFVNDTLVFASESERFSGIKNDSQLNDGIINYALKFGKPELVCWYENPYKKTLRQLLAGQGWIQNVKKYVEAYPNVQAFLPVVVETDEKGTFAGFTNEATFAANFTQEMGYLTNETLQDYQNFQTAGCVIKKSVIEDFGGFKSSIKLTFVYEFLLRLTYNSVSIMTIPRLGYKHTNMREGSIFWNYKFGENKMLEDEVKFWVQTAKKEYFFVNDRNIKYQSENV